MVEVDLRPGTPGCVRYPLGCLTLGLVPLLTRNAEGHFIRRMDDQGVETRSGKRIGWDEFTKATRVRAKMTSSSSGHLSDELLLESPKGKASLPLWRAANADEALSFATARLPERLFIQPPKEP